MQELTVSREESGQRLDKYLRRRLPQASSSFLYKMLRKKNITLRGKKADGSERVEEGDAVVLFLSDETIRKFSGEDQGAVQEQTGQEMLRAYRKLQPLMGGQPVLYEDHDILILRKPAGVLSQKAAPSDVSVNEWLRGYLQTTGEISGVYQPSVCNRLDRNTGGILLCAKTLPGSRALTRMIRDRSIRKTYRMVVVGQLREAGRIEGELVKDRGRNRVYVADRSRQNAPRHYAVTVYRPVQIGTNATLVEADLITGRSHQLRVHMASIGHPIIGDLKYGGPKTERRGGQLLWCSGIAFPEASEDPQVQEILAPVAGRVFSSPPPGWWEKYYGK